MAFSPYFGGVHHLFIVQQAGEQIVWFVRITLYL